MNLLEGNFNEEVCLVAEAYIYIYMCMCKVSGLCRLRNQLQDSAASFQEALKAWRQGRMVALFLHGEAEPSKEPGFVFVVFFFLQVQQTSSFSLSTGC